MNSGERLLLSVQMCGRERQACRPSAGQVSLQLLLVLVLLGTMAILSAMGPGGPEGLAVDGSAAEPLIVNAEAGEVFAVDAFVPFEEATQAVTVDCRPNGSC